MEKFKFFLLSLVLCIGIISCGEENDTPMEKYPVNGSSDNGNTNTGNSHNSILQEISENVAVTATYYDYAWHINILTHLSEIYPDEVIRYGIEFGYEDYIYYVYVDGHKESYSFVASVFLPTDDSPYVEQAMYYQTYLVLQEKIQNNESLTDEEEDLLEGVIDDLDSHEDRACMLYVARVFVEINGTRFYIKEI